jgi:hypothetical protein
VWLPAISQDVAQLMAKLIGKLRPGTLADVNDNPGHAAAIGVQPDGRRPGCVLVDASMKSFVVKRPIDIVGHKTGQGFGRSLER